MARREEGGDDVPAYYAGAAGEGYAFSWRRGGGGLGHVVCDMVVVWVEGRAWAERGGGADGYVDRVNPMHWLVGWKLLRLQ